MTAHDADFDRVPALRELDERCLDEFSAWTEAARDRELQQELTAERLEEGRKESRARQLVLVKERRSRQQLVQYGETSWNRVQVMLRGASKKRAAMHDTERRRRLLLQIDEGGRREKIQREDQSRHEIASRCAARLKRAEEVSRVNQSTRRMPYPIFDRTAVDIAREAEKRRERRQRLTEAQRELQSDEEDEDPLRCYVELEYLRSAEQQLLRRSQRLSVEEAETPVRQEIDYDEDLTRAGLLRVWRGRAGILEARQVVWRSDRSVRAKLRASEFDRREALLAEENAAWGGLLAETESRLREEEEKRLKRERARNATVAGMLEVSQDAARRVIVAGEEDERDAINRSRCSVWDEVMRRPAERMTAWSASVAPYSASVRENALQQFRRRMEERRKEEAAIQEALRSRGPVVSSLLSKRH